MPLEVRRATETDSALHETTMLTEPCVKAAWPPPQIVLLSTPPTATRPTCCRAGDSGGIAFPLRAQEHVMGSIVFLFDRRDALDDDTQARRIVADLAAQALERARLYEGERESRAALDRILQVAPRFLADERRDAIQAICREARTTFGADYGVFWRIEGRPRAPRGDPPRPETGHRTLFLEDFPRLRGAIQA